MSERKIEDRSYCAAQKSVPQSTSEVSEPYSIFDKRQKALIVLLVSTAATFSGLASNIYFPALPTVAEDLDVSVELVNLSITTYLIFQGLAPSLWGPLSDAKGRRVAYVCTFLVFLGSSVGLAQTKNYATLIVLRCLQSTGSASTIAIGSGVIGDITTREERGGYMGVFQAGLLVPVAVGPIIGGALAESLGWRAIFWFLTIYCAIFLILLVLLLPETLRAIVGNGSRTSLNLMIRFPLSTFKRLTHIKWTPQDPGTVTPTPRRGFDLTAPLRILFSKQAASIICFLAIYYTIWQMSITAMATLFEENYHLSTTQLGLTYIANGVGSIIGTLITGKILNLEYRRLRAKMVPNPGEAQDSMNTTAHNLAMDENKDDFPLERARLGLIPLFSILQCISILLFGWTVQYSDRVHIAVPIVSTFITGWTTVSTQSVIMTYLVDVFSERSAAASASLNLARCLLAAGGTSIVTPLVNAVGVGWGFTICVAVQVLALSGVAIQWKMGGKWRKAVREKEGHS